MSRLSSTTSRFPLPRGKTELSRDTSRSGRNSPLSPTSPREEAIKSSTPGPPTSPVTSKFRQQDSADLTHRKSPISPGSDWETVPSPEPKNTAQQDKDGSSGNGPKNDGSSTST